MKQCKCGSKMFSTICSYEVNLTLTEKGELVADTQENYNNLGDDGLYICVGCRREYPRSDFEKIIYQ